MVCILIKIVCFILSRVLHTFVQGSVSSSYLNWNNFFFPDLIHCTNEPNVSIPQLANLLIERSQNANWVVVFKALITVHHLMCYGNEVSIIYSIQVIYLKKSVPMLKLQKQGFRINMNSFGIKIVKLLLIIQLYEQQSYKLLINFIQIKIIIIHKSVMLTKAVRGGYLLRMQYNQNCLFYEG